jgi:hypothetical protein
MPRSNAPHTRRLLWILNHTTLMEWEVPMLRELGFEVFVPKLLPVGPNGRTAKVTDAHDGTLTIPAADLDHLNTVNFYDAPLSRRTAAIVNRHFGTAIAASIYPGLYYLLRCFEGRIFMRAFGHAGDFDYDSATATIPFASLDHSSFAEPSSWPGRILARLRSRLPGRDRPVARNVVTAEMFRVRSRLHLAAAYEQIITHERPFLRQRSVFLPLALPASMLEAGGGWSGGEGRVLFVCPNIDQIDYYRRIYLRFREELGQFPSWIAGRQDLQGVDAPLTTQDDRILGFVTRERLDDLMRRCACMFYHSQEPRHLHYHPLEAIVAGQPLVFMAGGLLESLGGGDQPGLCRSYDEAREKIGRLLAGDAVLREAIRQRQRSILRHFEPAYCDHVWRENFLPLVGEVA